MLRSLFSMIFLLIGVASQAASFRPPADTVILAASKQSQTFDTNQGMVQIKLEAEKHKNLTGSGQYVLILDSVIVHTLPEGVYELYLLPGYASLPFVFSAEDRSFVDLLNLYNLSDKSKPPVVSINATRSAERLMPRDRHCKDLQLVVFFRGNEMPDQKPVAHTGKISFGKIRLLYVNEG